MAIINHAISGDHQGLIKFKNKRKGLYIDKSSFFKRRNFVFINKDTVESYELIMNEDNSSGKGALTKSLIGGAVFGIGGAITGGNARKTVHKYLVSIVFKDGTKALCELDSQFYEILITLLY